MAGVKAEVTVTRRRLTDQEIEEMQVARDHLEELGYDHIPKLLEDVLSAQHRRELYQVQCFDGTVSVVFHSIADAHQYIASSKKAAYVITYREVV